MSRPWIRAFDLEMSYNQVKALLIFVAAMVFAVWMGFAIAEENYGLLVLGACATVATILLLMPGYAPLLAFGLLDPFSVPLPMIWGFPPLALTLGFCAVKYALARGLAKNAKEIRVNAIIPAFLIFFGWIVVRYCVNPALPNAAGFGESTTGFRPYLNYAICFGVIIALGRFVQTRTEILRLTRSLGWISVFFIFLFVPLMFTRSFAVGSVLSYLGLFVTTYDNGIFRFVVLPGFGITLISLLLFPQLFPVGRWMRVFLLMMGAIAVVLGGSRSSLGMATIVIIFAPLLRRKFRQSALIFLVTALLYFGAYFVGENIAQRDQAGIFRVLALVSPAVADSAQVAGTWEFREVRWRRAMEEIRNHPWLGRGYGGVQNAFVSGDWAMFEEARIEVDLAAGGVHNGYIACALAFGIPAALLFIGILGWATWHNGRLAMRQWGEDVLAGSIHGLVCVSLLAYAVAIYIGTDLNNPMIWLFLGMGVLMKSIKRLEIPAIRSEAPRSVSTIPVVSPI
jgi:hypothetical protein